MLSPLSSLSRVMKIGLTSTTLSQVDMSTLARWTIRPRLMAISGVANVAIWDLFIWGPISKIYGAIPVKRGEADLQAIKSALRVLKNGGLVLLAPEGTRSPTYQMQAGKEGAALIALRSGATIVPVGVVGTHQVKDYWFSFKRAPVRLSVGKPFCVRPQPANGRRQRGELEAITHEMMYRVARELPIEFRGVYGDVDQATRAYLTPLES
jgi:1-acyl-sn-glycerol-3-phosphate acyltransferase